jgi:transposase
MSGADVHAFVATVRPRRRREPYLLTETLPGEQAQVDWATSAS